MLILAALWLVLYWLIAFGVADPVQSGAGPLHRIARPAHGRFIEVGDGACSPSCRRTAARRPGQSEPPLVFIHGLLGQLNDFAYALAALFPRTPRGADRPAGSGYSQTAHPQTLAEQAAIMAQAIEALDLEKPLVVGHSLGGAVALALALDHRDRIGGLALVAPLTHLVAARSKIHPAALAWRSRLHLLARGLDPRSGPDAFALGRGARTDFRARSHARAVLDPGRRPAWRAAFGLAGRRERYSHAAARIAGDGPALWRARPADRRALRRRRQAARPRSVRARISAPRRRGPS